MRFILPAVAFLLLAPSVFAWGSDGHRVVAEIASRHLSPQASAQVAEILGDKTMADVATWADTIRDARPETGPWHYFNPPPGAEQVRLSDSPEAGSVLSCIIEQTRILNTTKSTAVQKAEALRYVIHMVGDLHQPMHVSRASDRGGNRINVTLKGKPTNLHAAWDSGFIRLRERRWPQIVEALNDEVTPKQIEEWSAPIDVEAWGTESYLLAMKHGYKVPASGELDDAYIQQAQNISDEQLSKAGVRLAAVLNVVFEE